MEQIGQLKKLLYKRAEKKSLIPQKSCAGADDVYTSSWGHYEIFDKFLRTQVVPATDQRLKQEKFVTNCVITLTLTEKSLGNGMQYKTKQCVYLQDLIEYSLSYTEITIWVWFH
jgi:hypothetical protein